MGEKITVYGIECDIPTQPKPKDIAGYGLKTSKQKFQRVPVPESFDNLNFSDEKEPIYTPDQVKFITQELERCINGYWFYNKGIPTYITGDHYYYISYWTLEDGSIPEYRDADRRFFTFLNECRNDDYILGVLRGKKRREGATSQGTSIETKTATFNENARCGNISKTGKDAEDIFVNMIVYGFRALPIFLKPRYDGTEDPKRKLTLVKPVSKKQQVNLKGYSNKREGLNSSIDWRNLALNSYDSGRITFILIDETGKWEEIDINAYWLIVSQTLTQGAKKVGFAFMPTTVNPPNKGGERFRIFWDKCNQFIHGRKTPTRVVQYFQPAEDGLPGFIDEYGISMLKEAGEWLDDAYAKLESEEDRSEFKRMYPRSEKDMFTFAQTESPFTLSLIEEQLDFLRNNKIFIRVGRLIWNGEDEVEFVDDAKGSWQIYKLPDIPNRVVKSGHRITPGNHHNFVGGVDPYRNSEKGDYSSPGTVCIFQNLDSSDLDNTGMPAAIYKGRPNDKDLFFDECLKAFVFYGCKGLFESDATTDYKKYFNLKGATNLLHWTPDIAINPNKKKALERGVKSADPFALEKQLQVAIRYIDNHCHKIFFPHLLDDLKRYNHDKRTKSDLTVALMMCLLCSLGTTKGANEDKKRGQVVETYSVNLWKP
jgi:hypothetical protein